jgi:hypothetical protein
MTSDVTTVPRGRPISPRCRRDEPSWHPDALAAASHYIDVVKMMRDLAVSARNIEVALAEAQEQLRRTGTEG